MDLKLKKTELEYMLRLTKNDMETLEENLIKNSKGMEYDNILKEEVKELIISKDLYYKLKLLKEIAFTPFVAAPASTAPIEIKLIKSGVIFVLILKF